MNRTHVFFVLALFSALVFPHSAVAQNDIFSDTGVIDVTYICDTVNGDDGCFLEGFAVLYGDTSSTNLHGLSQTSVSADSFDDGWDGYVVGDVLQDGTEIAGPAKAGDNGQGVAAIVWNVPINLNATHVFDVRTDSYYNYFASGGGCAGNGGCVYIASTQQMVTLGRPAVTSVSPPYVFVGTTGTLTLNGSNFVNPFGNPTSISTSKSGGTGFSVSTGTVGQTQASAPYTAALTATTGNWDIGLSYSLGSSVLVSTFGSFTVGDPTPVISSISPSSWNAGQTNIPVTIKGSYFGSNPQLIIVGSGITSYSITSHVDNGQPNGAQIGANVSVFACALAGTATITVTSQGYNGTGFTPAYPGQSSSGTSTASIVATQTGLIGITGANLETNAVNVTLSGTSCDTGSLDVTANGVSNHPQTAYNGGAPVGPGSYNVALDRPNMPADTYSSVTGDWNFSPTPAQTMFNLTKTWWVQGYTQHTQYNTPAESKCSTTQATAFIYNPSACTWSSALSMSKQFISQAELNGTGTADKSGHALLHAYGGQCKNYPSGASSANSFYSISSVTGACNVALNGSSVATYPNPKAKGSKWNCNDDLLIVNSSNANVAIDKVLDYCPACSKWGPGYVAHVDHYSSSNACTLSSLPGNWAADTH